MAKVPLDVAAGLRLVPGLAEASGPLVDALAAHANHRVAHANVTLLAQGATASQLIFLVRGAVKVVHMPEGAGDGVLLRALRGPCRVPDSSIFDGLPATASAITLRSSHLVTIERAALFDALAHTPKLARYLLAEAADDARACVQRIDELVVGSADERIMRLLDGLAHAHGTTLNRGRFIALPLRRSDIARMVNTTTATVSRLLARLERDGRARSTRDGIWWSSPRAGD